MTLNDFINGYGAYVWSAYGLCFIVLLFNIVQPLLKGRKIRRELKKRLRVNEKK